MGGLGYTLSRQQRAHTWSGVSPVPLGCLVWGVAYLAPFQKNSSKETGLHCDWVQSCLWSYWELFGHNEVFSYFCKCPYWLGTNSRQLDRKVFLSWLRSARRTSGAPFLAGCVEEGSVWGLGGSRSRLESEKWDGNGESDSQWFSMLWWSMVTYSVLSSGVAIPLLKITNIQYIFFFC